MSSTSDHPSNHDATSWQANMPGEAASQGPAARRRVGNAWPGLLHWFQANTFAPRWLPQPLRHPLIGCLVAVFLEFAAAGLILLTLQQFPSFAFRGILTDVVVILVALWWGAGPSLLAAFVGTFLLYYALLPPYGTWILTEPADVLGLALYLLVGVCISLLAGRSERARRRAEEQSRLLAQAQARSALDYQRLRTVLDVLPSAVVIAGPHGQILETNPANKMLWGDDIPLAAGMAQYAVYTARWARSGKPLAPEEWTLARALNSGEVIVNDEIEIETPDGQRKVILNSAAPIRDETGAITGAVVSAQDISEVRRLEQRTREALDALVAMAEAMVQGPPSADTAALAGEAPLPAADVVSPGAVKRLAELTRSVLGCWHVSLNAIETETGWLRPLVVVGLSPEQEQAWWASWSLPQCLEERFGDRIAAALHTDESVPLDARQAPERYRYNLYQAQSGLIMPMRMGEELIGILFIDYGEREPNFSPQREMALIRAISRLGALLLERDRLLRRWAEARANELALRATKEQMDTFLGMVSHELKTPLTSIRLALQISQRRIQKLGASVEEDISGIITALPSFQTQLVRTEGQVERLDRLVNDLLDASRIQAGKLELRPKQVNLGALVQRVVEEQREAAPERAINLQVPAGLQAVVDADPVRIEQVVINYLTNALKYSPEAFPVDVGMRVAQQEARVWVRDQGPGLPPEEQGRVWERFHRARDVEVQSGTGVGLGLGLFICRTIIERHQGQVGVESAPGAGSTFWFTLPLSARPDALESVDQGELAL